MNHRTRVKVCGTTSLEDARAAVALGVDCLGFIFAKQSPRLIEPEAAREIIRKMPPFVDVAGVFMDEEADLVQEIIQYCGLTLVQLHGSESPAYCDAIPVRVIKSLRIGPFSEDSQLAPYADHVQGFLLDTYHQSMAGGTGETFDWGLVEKVAPPGPVILAGGLNPVNVRDAIVQVRPFAVDVNSGVESAPGCKDQGLLEKFLSEVRRADRELAGADGECR